MELQLEFLGGQCAAQAWPIISLERQMKFSTRCCDISMKGLDQANTRTHTHARSYPDRAIHLRQSSLAGTEAAAGTAAGQQMSLDTPISNEWMPEHSAASSYVIHLRFTGSAMVGPAALRPAPNTGSGFGSVWHGRKYLPSRRVFACLGDNWKSNKGLACSLCSPPCCPSPLLF